MNTQNIVINVMGQMTTPSGINIVQQIEKKVPELSGIPWMIEPPATVEPVPAAATIRAVAATPAPLPPNVSEEQLNEAAREAFKEEVKRIAKIKDHQLLQASLSFWIAIAFVVGSAALTLWGLVQFLEGGQTEKALTAFIGAASNYFSNIPFKLYQYANDKIPGMEAQEKALKLALERLQRVQP